MFKSVIWYCKSSSLLIWLKPFQVKESSFNELELDTDICTYIKTYILIISYFYILTWNTYTMSPLIL